MMRGAGRPSTDRPTRTLPTAQANELLLDLGRYLVGCDGPDRVNRHLVRGFYIFVAVVVCPLLAWNLAVDATNRGLGWRGFFIALLGLPVLGAVLAAALLRRRRREATFGAIGALTATLVLVVVLVFVTLSSR